MSYFCLLFNLSLNLFAYCNADWAGDSIVIDFCIFLG